MPSPNVMDFFERASKIYADAMNTILINHAVMKCQ